MTASVPKRVVPLESPLTARAGPYMYLCGTENCDGPRQGRLCGFNQTVLLLQSGVSGLMTSLCPSVDTPEPLFHRSHNATLLTAPVAVAL